jgi:hypothetical protein
MPLPLPAPVVPPLAPPVPLPGSVNDPPLASAPAEVPPAPTGLSSPLPDPCEQPNAAIEPQRTNVKARNAIRGISSPVHAGEAGLARETDTQKDEICPPTIRTFSYTTSDA